MDRGLSEDTVSDLKELITSISDLEEGTEDFDVALKCFTKGLKKTDTMCFPSKHDIDQAIDGMMQKFYFHGFPNQAENLGKAYTEYIPDDLPRTIATKRLNVVKFLLCLSESPIKYFQEHPDEFLEKEVENVEEINWAEYLNDGFEDWYGNFDDTSDDDSALGQDESDECEVRNTTECISVALLPTIATSDDKMVEVNLEKAREDLQMKIQHSWFSKEHFQILPNSKWKEANVALLWDKYLRDQFEGLILIEKPTILTEYCVIREILWQMWKPHASAAFELCGDSIRPKPNVTIASVRLDGFQSFLNEFIPYIELMDHFRAFKDYLFCVESHNEKSICRTYRSYCDTLFTIINPIFKELIAIEEKIQKQDITYTLLDLVRELDVLFRPLKILKEIHNAVILDSESTHTFRLATTLICNLHSCLLVATDKLEQDLIVVLFLGTCRHYFNITDDWLVKDGLLDYTEEFIIEKNLKLFTDSYNSEREDDFLRNDIDKDCRANSFLKIFCGRVLQIGRNLNFLRRLENWDRIGRSEESLHQEFVRRVSEKLCLFYHTNFDDSQETKEDLALLKTENYVFPNTNCEFAKLENNIDTSDGFLCVAFCELFNRNEEKQEIKEPGLFEKISGITNHNLFPKINFFEPILLDILNERFTISGLKLKDVLIKQHLLEKQLQFLRHTYLFWDDIIFPFYRRLFIKNKVWGHDVWLTSQLQDIFMDIYPEVCERCSVQTGGGWSKDIDFLTTCDSLCINYDLQWPFNVIVQESQMDMYKEIFQFILKLKWALHTVNELCFTGFGSRMSKHAAAKLRHQNFCLTNVLNSLQHFVFGMVFNKAVKKFELDFEKADDLNSLIESHSDFINSIHQAVVQLQQHMMRKDKPNNVLDCIALLKLMWHNPKCVTLEKINECKSMYQRFYRAINPIINPVYIYGF